MEFQIAEAIELIKTLAETENLTQSQALTAFVAEAGLDIEYASQLKAALYEEYTLTEMAEDTLTKALHSVFVEGTQEELSEMETKETQEGTKYKVRVQDRASGSSYVRYATREKIAELRANPNISSVEITDHGSTGEDDRGARTAAAKGGGRDYDGDGKKESSSKEHAGVVHNAIQRAKGGTPDGKDTRKEEVEMEEGLSQMGGMARELGAKGGRDVLPWNKGAKYNTKGELRKPGTNVHGEKIKSPTKSKSTSGMGVKEEHEMEEGIDFKGAKRIDDARDAERKKKEDKHPILKDKRLAKGKFRPGSSDEEWKEGAREHLKAKDRVPSKKGKKMWESYLEARAAIAEEKKKISEGLDMWKPDGDAGSDDKNAKMRGKEDAAKKKKKSSYLPDLETVKALKKRNKVDEGYKGKHGQSDEEAMDSRSDAAKQISGDSKESGASYSHRSYRGVGKPAKPGERQKHQGKMTDADREELAIRKNELKKKTQKEEFIPEADIYDAGRENSSQRDKAKSGKKIDGKGVDNSTRVKLMPTMEAVVTETELSPAQIRLAGAKKVNEALRSKIHDLAAALYEEDGGEKKYCKLCKKEETRSECSYGGEAWDKNTTSEKKESIKLDDAGMPIFETKAESRNNARPGPSKDMIDPPADPLGDKGHMNPKGKPKRYKERGEAPGDRRPNDPTGPDLPNEKGTVPNGSGV